VRVLRGVSRGTPPRKIVANTATTITWDLPMVINPGDVWIIEEATWPYSCDTTSLDNGNPPGGDDDQHGQPATSWTRPS